jgi:hypothetical protein
MKQPEWPYDLPIWRRSHKADSPDHTSTAEIALATEVSMGNPTIGELVLTDLPSLPRCSPCFIWSDDSRYLAVPQFFERFGLFRRQRMLILDTKDHKITKSREIAYYFQPESFSSGVLEAVKEPFRAAEKITWRVPDDFPPFERLGEPPKPTTQNKRMEGNG